MSKASSISAMQRAIINYINSRIPETPNRAHKGTISGKRVIIGNKSYPYDPVVDTYFSDGDAVYCILPDSGSIAAVVGVV